MFFDWHQFHASEHTTPAVVDSRRRLRIGLAGFVVLLLAVFARAVQLEVSGGAAFRAEATRPLRREKSLPGVRGRILARDGTVLACDKQMPALTVHYRYLQEPSDQRWLRRTARARLSRTQCKEPHRVEAEMTKVDAEKAELARRLQTLSRISPQEWSRRARRIQARVERIAQSVRRRRGNDITVAEQLDYHLMVEVLSLAVVVELEGHAEQYPGVRIITRTRRAYPSGSLAAHVLGHLGRVEKKELEDDRADYHAEDFVGRTGLERRYESLLRGRCGVAVELTDHSGRILSSFREEEPGVGRDLVLSLDRQLQLAAETLLDSALQRSALHAARNEPAGGAIVVVDIRSGAVRAAASAPRFDPALFLGGDPNRLAAVLQDEAHPLFDRAGKMSLPPDDVFETLSAIELLESSTIDPRKPFCFTSTPLQIARMIAAVANGGELVTPHVVERIGVTESTVEREGDDALPSADGPIEIPAPRPIPGLRPATLEIVRNGLARAVSDPKGSAHGTVHLEQIAIAGKLSTAQDAHAWFAGYVPADDPRLAFAVMLEHSGDAAVTVGPVAKRLVLRMLELGLLEQP